MSSSNNKQVGNPDSAANSPSYLPLESEQNSQKHFDVDSDQDFIPSTQDLLSTKQLSKRFVRIKRKQEDSENLPTKRSNRITMSIDDRKEIINLLDPEGTLCILNYMNLYQNDPLVRDYVDTLLQTKFVPILPNQETINSWLKHDVIISTPPDLMKQLVNNFMKYFQNKYHRNNLQNANDANVHLFNPKNDFWIPNFELLPQQTLETLTNLKKKYVEDVQKESCKGSDFMVQLLILRNVRYILGHINEEAPLESDEEKDNMTQYILAMAYSTAKIEFPKVFNVKLLDFSKFTDRVKHSEPKWRTEDPQNIPKDSTSRLATNLVERIDNNQIIFSGEAVANEHEQFMTNGCKFQPNQLNRGRGAPRNYSRRGSRVPRNYNYNHPQNNTQRSQYHHHAHYNPQVQKYNHQQRGTIRSVNRNNRGFVHNQNHSRGFNHQSQPNFNFKEIRQQGQPQQTNNPQDVVNAFI